MSGLLAALGAFPPERRRGADLDGGVDIWLSCSCGVLIVQPIEGPFSKGK